MIFAAVGITTAWTKSEIVWLFVLCGALAMLIKAPPRVLARRTPAVFMGSLSPLLTGIHGLAPFATVGVLFLFFLKAGAFVFGSGLAIVPFLYGGVVGKFHWLTERQFVDAVAIAMITPGPVVITAAFIGYLVAGHPGAASSSLGGVISGLSPLIIHCVIRRTVLPPLRTEPAGEGLCPRRYRGRSGCDRRGRIHPRPAITYRPSNRAHWARHHADPDAYEKGS